MKEETNKKYILEPWVVDFNQYGQFKSYGYHNMLGFLADTHLKDTDSGVGVQLAGKYGWVIVSMTIEIEQAVTTSYNKLYGYTWYVGKKGPYYRREFVILDEQEQVMFKGVSFSILMDLEDRSIYRKRDLPFELMENTEIRLIDADPKFKETLEYTFIYERPVTNSNIDNLGHVNNVRYNEFCYDAMNLDEISQMNKLKTINMYFHSEMRLGDVFKVGATNFDSKRAFEVYNQTKGEKSFTMLVQFKE